MSEMEGVMERLAAVERTQKVNKAAHEAKLAAVKADLKALKAAQQAARKNDFVAVRADLNAFHTVQIAHKNDLVAVRADLEAQRRIWDWLVLCEWRDAIRGIRVHRPVMEHDNLPEIEPLL